MGEGFRAVPLYPDWAPRDRLNQGVDFAVFVLNLNFELRHGEILES